ncbi:hypothetical protein PTTG_03926 [Puccinia triticina 1-1 BBBD Race 1]|uniref:Mitochondrial import inner membrane translocase subunit TIM23 n=2 Tax=Puccinia triticina TaxID=208348 RepID=A0A180GHT0_PUCT1|nr:uncharacterized protein PtA15_14A471 [Puccinia triticina]OAV92307.1 hypothetical protein PTTG_03926 [Puccinia triticina 1-1 BBBD Race 1]WAQ91587.1 hypothetical protein PtA15_14A471 [Puccinia triticina]
MSSPSSSSVNQQASPDHLDTHSKASKSSHPPDSVLNLPILDPILSAYAQPSSLHPLSNVNAGLDYLSLEDSKLSTIAGSQSVLPNRGWSDELCYGTGTVYVGGLAFGGLWGFKEGWGRSKAIAAGRVAKSMPTFSTPPKPASGLSSTGSAAGMSTAASGASVGAASATHSSSLGSISWRLRLNAILNGITRRGSFTGNTCGILAVMYNAFNCTLDRQRGQHDQWNSVIAGALTGALFRCTAGLQKMFIASSLMAAGAMGWSAIKPTLIQK